MEWFLIWYWRSVVEPVVGVGVGAVDVVVFAVPGSIGIAGNGCGEAFAVRERGIAYACHAVW